MAAGGKPPKGFAPLRIAFLKRVKKSRQWLSREAKKENILDTKVAQAVVARRHGMRVQQYLQGADLDRVQQAIISNGIRSAPIPTAERVRGGKASAPKQRVISIGKAFKATLPLLSTAKCIEAGEMADVYPYLFLMENSIRDVVRRVMEANYGEDWWDTGLSGLAKTVKTNVEHKLKKEDEQAWHQRRGPHPIDYTTLGELKTIAVSKPNLFFPRLLGKKSWFEALIDELEPSRNVLAHMNPLSKVNAAGVRLRFDHWNQHLLKREVELLAAMTPGPS